ncbi:MAG: alpha/beta fold hydrolase [Candidatus Binatia bacterium]
MSRSETLTVRSVSVDLLRQGAGEPVLYLHGVQGLSTAPGTWPPFMNAVAERFEVFVPSHPGFAKTGRPDWYDSVTDLSDHYTDFLDALGIQTVRVIGHSFGGWVAAALAANAPHRVERLVLASPLGIWLPEIGQTTPDVFMYSPHELVEITYAEPTLAADVIPADLSQSEQWFADWSSFAMYGWAPYLHDPKLIHRLHRIKAPALIVNGEKDRVVPVAHAEAFQQRIPRAQLKVVSGAGHALPLERPDEFSAIVLDFLTRPAAQLLAR